MSWTDGVKNALASAAKTVGNSVAFIKGKFGVSVSDAQADQGVVKAEAVAADLVKVLEAYIDSIPGVPSIVAHLAAEAALKIIDSAIAGAGEAIKANN